VANREEFYPEFTQAETFSRSYCLQLGSVQCLALFEFDRDKPLGKFGGINGYVQLGKDIGQSASMVIVTMGDDDTANLGLFLHQVAYIGDYQVDAQHFLCGEHETGVNDDDVITVFYHHHVLADFTQSAEGDYL